MMTEEKVQEKAVLDPDHEILKRFQEALTDHYTRQIDRLNNEIFDYEAEHKKREEEKELLGVEVYEAQQVVCRQQKTLDEITQDVENINAAKQEVENQIKERKEKFKEAKEAMVAAEKYNMELQNEINSINLLISQVSQWESKIESNLVVNQRIAEKTRKDNLKLAEEKRKQDAQLYKVMCAIWKLESEIETMNIQSKLKETEQRELEERVTTGNTHLEALQAEYRCLMHSWNSVVVAIGSRDRIVECLRTETRKIREQIKSAIAEIEKTKKLTKKEMNTNERLVLNKARAELDVSNCKQLLDEQLQKYNEHMEVAATYKNMADQTQKDIDRIVVENNYKRTVLSTIMKDYDKVYTKKSALERKLLEIIENQAANDKVAESLYRMLNTTKERKRDLEIIMNEAENKQSLIATEIEAQKYTNSENERLMTDVDGQRMQLEAEADGIQASKVNYEMLFRKKERHVTVLNNKLEDILERSQTRTLASPQEVRLLTLEKHIEELQEKIKNLQIFWLREQKNLLNVSKDRQDQLHKLNLLKKQNLILEQKNLKVSNEIEEYKRQERMVVRNINNLQNKISNLCDSLTKKKDRKLDLDKSNYYVQSQYEGKLKDCELECLQLEAEIAEIEDEKIVLSKELIQVNREVLEWEQRVQLGKETKLQLRGVQHKGGEVENMRQEIQRMSVIYSQLKKAQEKLIKDLEHCVSRRDAIFTVAEARQKRSKEAEEKTRINYTRKLDDVKNKIKQHENNIKLTDEKIASIEVEKTRLSQQIEKTESEIEFCEMYCKSLREDIENHITNRQLKYEMVLRVQKRLNCYRDLSLNKKPFLHTKKALIPNVLSEQKDMNAKLCRVLEQLKADFPNLDVIFQRLYNTLKLHVFTRYESHLEVRMGV
ncbi:coiled-coil domain-containing protein 40 [Sitophilus oryzae]|uniref:Coiled-coil domain-containing protein 40 n=1 Tax=Sitophilus oryzae TaxID=7048 RepID=A0A6J2YUZ4_SITOR|nr:coiled-coil domain-containing protein 40 [Sitophilus oryzae]